MNYYKRVTIMVQGEEITAPMLLLNSISLWALEASNHYNSIGAQSLGIEAKESSEQIYDQLEEMGLYKE